MLPSPSILREVLPPYDFSAWAPCAGMPCSWAPCCRPDELSCDRSPSDGDHIDASGRRSGDTADGEYRPNGNRG